MESREIIIVSTKTQKKSVIMSGAETLGELKDDLDANNIDYEDMTFYEGLSKTELKSDDSQLPKDVSYKGTTTNKLVFMLTNTNKKIKSGTMTRAEAYEAIKANNLQKECIIRFGRSFTQCKTTDLISLIDQKTSVEPLAGPDCVKEEVKKEEVKVVKRKEILDSVEEVADVCNEIAKIKLAIKNLVEHLVYEDVISDLQSDEVLNALEVSNEEVVGTETSENCTLPYSKDELDDMFDFVK